MPFDEKKSSTERFGEFATQKQALDTLKNSMTPQFKAKLQEGMSTEQVDEFVKLVSIAQYELEQ